MVARHVAIVDITVGGQKETRNHHTQELVDASTPMAVEASSRSI